MASAKPKTVRNNPRPRTADAGDKTRLLNKDPNRHYVLVGQTHHQVEEYESRGYRVEEFQGADGLRLAVRTAKMGEPITYNDSVLMSIDKAEKDRIDRYGEDGDEENPIGGWAEADRIEKRISNKRFAEQQLMRGIKGARGYVAVSHEVEPLREFSASNPFTE